MSQAPSAAAAPAAIRNPLAFVWRLIISPRAALAQLRDTGRPSWLWLAGLALVVVIGAAIATAPIVRAASAAEAAAVLERMGEDMTAQERAQAEQMLALTNSPLMTVVLPASMGVVGVGLGWLLRGGVLFLLGLLLGGHARFADMFRMSVWTTLPDIVRQVVAAAATVISGGPVLAGLSGLLPATEPGSIPALGDGLLRAFLSGIDVYWIWGLVLTTFGVAVTASFSVRKGLLVTLLYWVLTVLASLGFIWLSLSMAASAGALGG